VEIETSVSGSLVLGASGQVGKYLYKCLRETDEQTIGTSFLHSKPGLVRLDIRNKQTLAARMEDWEPQVVYLPAAMTNVDHCEQNPDLTYQINVQGVCNVAKETKRIGAKLVFFSTDYIFDGTNGPYSEDDLANPLCQYGTQKLISEHYIALHSSDYLIVRTTVVYGWESRGKNFVQRLTNSLKKGEQVHVPLDQIGNPTYAPNLAEAVVELATSKESGIFHIVGPELISRFDFAVIAAETFNLDCQLIKPVTTAELGQIANRPLQAGLRIDKVQEILQTELIDPYRGLLRMSLETKGDG
jgi:dTDP-4-dehydrorhamnose reductase